jgi:hypothetical protein
MKFKLPKSPMRKIPGWIILGLITLLAACAHQAPVQTPLKPSRPAKPAINETQLRERARQALQKATASGNEYSACVMFSTSIHRSADAAAPEVAVAAAANCAGKLDDYEQAMSAYHEINPIKPVSLPAQSAKERAHGDRRQLEQATRDAAIRSMSQSN